MCVKSCDSTIAIMMSIAHDNIYFFLCECVLRFHHYRSNERSPTCLCLYHITTYNTHTIRNQILHTDLTLSQGQPRDRKNPKPQGGV